MIEIKLGKKSMDMMYTKVNICASPDIRLHFELSEFDSSANFHPLSYGCYWAVEVLFKECLAFSLSLNLIEGKYRWLKLPLWFYTGRSYLPAQWRNVIRMQHLRDFIVKMYANKVFVFQERNGEMEMSSLCRAWSSCHPFELVSCWR